MGKFLHDSRIYYNPIEFAMAHIGRTWKIPILISLRKGSIRYGDLKKTIPHISDKMLYTQLRELEDKNMIKRQVAETLDAALKKLDNETLLDISEALIISVDLANILDDFPREEECKIRLSQVELQEEEKEQLAKNHGVKRWIIAEQYTTKK